jgi:hypothetical protein
MYDLLRCVPRIESIAKCALDGNLDLKSFPFMCEEKESKGQKGGVANWHQDRDDAD